MLLCDEIEPMRMFYADVDAAAEQLLQRGVDLLEPPHDLPEFGHRVLFFADPEHNVVEIFAEI